MGGTSPDATLPEAVYALDLLLWSAAFHWLDAQACRDNPGAERDSSTRRFDRLLLYGGYCACVALAFILSHACLYVVGALSVVLIVRMLWTKA